MGRPKKMEENDVLNTSLEGEEVSLDLSSEPTAGMDYDIDTRPIMPVMPKEEVTKVSAKGKHFVNCLRNERVIVRHINRASEKIKDPKHVLFGGMANGAIHGYTVPMAPNGMLVSVLTKEEQEFLEHVMGLEANALSVFREKNNYWDTSSEVNFAEVELGKNDTILDLSIPTDYIKYKVLLTNKDSICPSMKAYQDTPKASYEYILISEGDSDKAAIRNVNTRKEAYKLLGKIEDDYDILRFIVESLEGRPISEKTKIELLQAKVDDLIQANAGLFVKTASDDMLPTKVLIKKGIRAGVISKRGDYLYLTSDNTPLCANGQEPTLNVAAAYLNLPRNQELKFIIEAKVTK